MSLTKKDVTKKLLEDVVGVFNKVVLEETSQIATGPKVTKAALEADIAKCMPLLEPDDKAEFSEKDLEVMAVMGWGFSEGEVEEVETKEVETKEAPPANTNVKKKTTKGKPEIAERNKMIESLIAEGKHTSIQIVEKVMEKYPGHSKGGIATVVADSKNEKYNRFAKLTVMDPETKILSFK